MKKVLSIIVIVMVLSMAAYAAPGKGKGLSKQKKPFISTENPVLPDTGAVSETPGPAEIPSTVLPALPAISPVPVSNPISADTSPAAATSQPAGRSSSGETIWRSQLVYVTLDKDILGTNDTVAVTLDARNTKGVRRAEAVFLAPDATYRLVVLKLISGTKEYGTWSANITGLMPGKYVLKYVDLYGWTTDPMTWPVKDRSFFVVNGTTNSGSLAILFSVLEKNRIDEPGPVAVRIDAMDRIGISQAYATVESSRGDISRVDMRIISGDAFYGTWQGAINASVPDTTYSVRSITLANGKQSRTYSISGRSVYVEAPYPELQAGKKTGKLFTLPASQFLPTIIGFTIAGIILAFYISLKKIRKGKHRSEISA